MQQTETSKLNLIEKDDVFSPDPLNFNAEKLSDILAVTDFGARAARDAQRDLESRVTALEVHKIAIGTYVGNTGKDTFVDVGFTPAAVLVFNRYCRVSHTISCLALNGFDVYLSSEQYPQLAIVENGFKAFAQVSYDQTFSAKERYHYIAFG